MVDRPFKQCYTYDSDGSVCGILYNDTPYYFNKNLQGDVISIINMAGNTLAKYTYDAWGKMLSVTDAQGNAITNSSHIALINPYRYRGYYFDSESNFYYLQNRYYDPETGRFISPDHTSYLDPQSFTGLNLYAYCGNDPVMYSDSSGHIPEWLGWIISGTAIVGGIVLCATGVGGILGGVLIGAGAGSLINGYTTKANGGDFTAGYIGGAISGALCGVGAGLGGAAFAAATKVANFACLGYLALGVTASFAGGFAGNLAGTIYTNWHNSGFESVNIDWEETLVMSTAMGALNVFAGIGAGMTTAVCETVKLATHINSIFTLKFLAGLIAAGTEAFYDLTSYFINKLNP